MSGPEVTDPLALMIGGGGAVIGGLCSILLAVVFSIVRAIKEDLHSLRVALTGDGGTAVGVVTQLAEIRGRLGAAEAEISSLKNGTLTRELFERETQAQNDKLEDLKRDTKSLDRKVESLDRNVASRPWSQSSMSAVRPPTPREEPPSDPPAPPRPRLPSRPK